MFILQLFNDKTITLFEVNDDGVVLSHQHMNDLLQCPKIPVDVNLIALFPGEGVSIRSVKLPRMRASEKLQAIPYLLEEQLADNPENMQVIIGDTYPDGLSTVALVNKAQLQEQIKILHALSLFPRCLLPDFLALARENDAWSILIDSDMALVRINNQDGFSVDTPNLLLLLSYQLKKENKPKKIICWMKDQIIDAAEFQKLDIEIEMRDASKLGYFDFKTLITKPAMNFLQGKYKPKSEVSDVRKNWMICGAVGAVLIAFLFLSQGVQWFYLRHQSAGLEVQVTQTYQTLFPGSKEVLEPHFRTAGLLKKFQLASKDTEFLRLMNIAGKTILTFPDIQITQLNFSSDKLQLTADAKNVDQLGKLSEALRAKELSVSQRVLSTGKNNVHAEITVKENE